MPSDFEFPETAPSAFYSSKPDPEDFDFQEGETRELFIIPDATNGYFSFMLAVRITDNQTGFERYEYACSFVYDLIEKKKINTLNEFFGGDDSEELIQKYCEENDMPGEITGFANFNIICSNEEESDFIPFDLTFAVENNIPFTETRDFSEILADGFTTESEEKSVLKWGADHITYNGKGCSYDILESSPLYPDFWVEKHNSIKKIIMEDMLRDFVDKGYDMTYISTNQKIISDEILERQLPDSNPDYMKNCYSYSSPHKVIYDAETLEKINITDIFTEEGIEYIYQNAEDMNFDSKEEFIEILNENKITCSVDIMNEADMVTVWLDYNENINLPADMMNSRYFDYDKYCEYNGD